MGRIKNPELFLLQLQLYPNHGQEKEQNENTSGHRTQILVAVWHMLTKEQDFIDIYLKRLEEQKKMEEQMKRLGSTVIR